MFTSSPDRAQRAAAKGFSHGPAGPRVEGGSHLRSGCVRLGVPTIGFPVCFLQFASSSSSLIHTGLCHTSKPFSQREMLCVCASALREELPRWNLFYLAVDAVLARPLPGLGLASVSSPPARKLVSHPLRDLSLCVFKTFGFPLRAPNFERRMALPRRPGGHFRKRRLWAPPGFGGPLAAGISVNHWVGLRLRTTE